jgi:hypothetical protein
MPYQLLHDLFPEMAEEETLSVTVFGDRSETGLPPGDYSFCEMFCNERGCDCRRVFLCVVASFRKGPEAVIAWGWESPEFYANWMGDDDPEIIAMLMGPCLNPGSPQSELARALLDIVRNVLLQDEAYVERIKRHYRHFRTRIDGKPTIVPFPRKAPTKSRKKIKKGKKRKGKG